MMLVAMSINGPWWLMYLIGVPLTLGRVLHGIGLSRNTGTSQLRFIGMILTWLAYVFAIVAIFWILVDPALVAPSTDALQ